MNGDVNTGIDVLQRTALTQDAEVSKYDLDKSILQHLNLGSISEKG